MTVIRLAAFAVAITFGATAREKTFNFSYQTSTGVLSGKLVGMLKADLTTIALTEVVVFYTSSAGFGDIGGAGERLEADYRRRGGPRARHVDDDDHRLRLRRRRRGNAVASGLAMLRVSLSG